MANAKSKSAVNKGKSVKGKAAKTATGRTISAANVAKAKVAYDRTMINVLVARNRDEGVTRIYPDRSRYVKAVASSADQRAVYDNGDPVASMLRNVSLEDLWKVAAKHLSPDVLKAKKELYADKNIGMTRMNIGNLIRGAIKRKEREAQIAKQAKSAK